MTSSPNCPSCATSDNLGGELLPESVKEQHAREARQRIGAVLKPKPRLNVWQWASRHRYVAKGVSAKTLDGARLYRPTDAPHQLKPQESATDPNVQVTVLLMASQIGGKTEIFNNVIGYHIHHAPRSVVVMYPTLDSAEKYSKKKFTPMVDASPELSKIILPARVRDSNNTILVKDFPGGSVFFVGANSTPSLRGASGAVLLGDEIDSCEPSAGEEGDPVELLFKRGESFPSCVKMLASTPTVKGFSQIWNWWELSDQQYWFVPCPKCGKYQHLKWHQVKWPKDADGRHEPEKAFLECSECAAGLSDKDRLEMYFNGEWRATAPFKGIAGFHLNGIYAPWPAQKGYASRLHQMAADFLRAKKGGSQKMKVWTNTFLTEVWEEEGDRVEHSALMKRVEQYSPKALPEQVLLVAAGIDVQQDRLEVETVGLGLDDETWGVEAAQIFGDTEGDQVWHDLAEFLSQSYTREDGVALPVTCAAIDMRHKTPQVRKFVQRSGIARLYPVYGIGGKQPLLVAPRFNKHYRLWTYAVSSHSAKDTLFARLRVEEPGPRYMHFPKGYGYTEEYFQQLTAEVLKTRFTNGFPEQFYEKIRDRNEALDRRVYFLAALDILKPRLPIIAARLKQQAKPKTDASAAATPAATATKEYILKPPASRQEFSPPPKPPPTRRRIRVGSWK